MIACRGHLCVLELTVFDPIILPDGRQLVNLRDAAVNITKLLPAHLKG